LICFSVPNYISRFLKNNLPWRQEKCYEQYEMFWHKDLPPWHCVSHFHQSLIASSHYFSRTITTFLGFNGIQHYQQKRRNSVKIQWLFLILARAQKLFKIIAFHTNSIGRHKKEIEKGCVRCDELLLRWKIWII